MVKNERLTLYVSLITLKENNLHPKVLNFLKNYLAKKRQYYVNLDII